MTEIVDTQIEQWRAFLSSRPGVAATDVDELTDHLLSHIDALETKGLNRDEAFLVAVKRVGALDEVAGEFAREHSDRLWKQLVLPKKVTEPGSGNRSLWVMLLFAVLLGLLFRFTLDATMSFYGDEPITPILALIAGGAVVVGGYFAWLRRPFQWPMLVAIVVLSGIIFAVGQWYPWQDPEHTMGLFLFHAPIAVLVALGTIYLADGWRQASRWMDYIRFLGEAVIYYALISMGVSVLTLLAFATFEFFGVDSQFIYIDVLPFLTGASVIVAIWLVQAKQNVVENMAPVLSMIFTPLFTVLLVIFVVLTFVTGQWLSIDRDMLIIVDIILAFVWALLLFSVSARPAGPPKVFDWLQIALVGSALLVDAIVLTGIAARLFEFGFTPNRVAALGENLVILVNLIVSLVLYLRFVLQGRSFAALERWQTRYIPVVGAWALFVALFFPLIFGFK